MRIIFDTDQCKRDKEDIDVILYLISIYAGSKITIDTFEKARQQKLLDFEKMYSKKEPFPNYVGLTETGSFIVESLMADSNLAGNNNSEERYKNLANKLRELYPTGKKPGYAWTWRDSPSCIVDRLKKFVLKYGDYPDDEIIDATKRYVASFNGDYTYMQLLKYFIWKNKVTGGELVDGRLVGEVERQSQLAAWLENKEEVNTSSDWDIELK